MRDPAAPSPPRWKGAQSLELVHQLNERCIELLCDVAAAQPGGLSLACVADNRELWLQLDPRARRRGARLPFVIVDAHFMDEEWWRCISGSQLRVADRITETSNGLPRQASENLMHETIMFAWQSTRWDKTVAMLSFGMLRSVAETIASLTPQRVREIATCESSAVQVRWGGDSNFWRHLLLAAQADDLERLTELHMHAKLLLCNQLIESPKSLTR